MTRRTPRTSPPTRRRARRPPRPPRPSPCGLFAAVDANGGSPANRGLVASNGVARQGTGNYSVTFSGDLSKCALSATIIGTGGGEISVQPTVASDRQSTSVDVRTFELQVADGPPAVVRNNSADRAFHLLADC